MTSMRVRGIWRESPSDSSTLRMGAAVSLGLSSPKKSPSWVAGTSRHNNCSASLIELGSWVPPHRQSLPLPSQDARTVARQMSRSCCRGCILMYVQPPMLGFSLTLRPTEGQNHAVVSVAHFVRTVDVG